LVTGESSSINIALCNVAETRCNYVQNKTWFVEYWKHRH